ncbi:formin like protein [Phaeodactylum tricornutum CCAP 1055/1]|uniref:Formin like protein n=1 Tax=Phaeodactylum tricornutum (strain CCAP 1055/1) TaxID=556484 RepID=B7FZU7_PHATC|nr:formin like protein [Phaeodactylum tricornutum CCAP 1055/1]EEC47776.1 formin like protein [Phaeodactylum tricornutum CCAP 1055/1]|eukprot:XP_002180368.1 formin like protein [Phaeodactylum tricornutum CCAP 1055/1]
MFGDRRSPAARRRAAGNRQAPQAPSHPQTRPPQPVQTFVRSPYDDEASNMSSRRRNLALFKYGSTTKRSTSSMDRSRQHAKEIALKLTTSASLPNSSFGEFADFSSAFGSTATPAPFTTATASRTTTTTRSSKKLNDQGRQNQYTSPRTSSQPPVKNYFFDTDPFPDSIGATPAESREEPRRAPPSLPSKEDAFFTADFGQMSVDTHPKRSTSAQSSSFVVAEWPSEEQSMATMPANSSMQSHYAMSHQEQYQTRPQTPPPPPPRPKQRTQRRVTTPPPNETRTTPRRSVPASLGHEASTTPNQRLVNDPAAVSPNPSVNSSGTAAARRRLRAQRRKGGERTDHGDRQSEPENTLLTTPLSAKRHDNFDNVPVNSGHNATTYAPTTATPPSSRKLQDHTAPLSNRAFSSAALKSTNQSAGSWSTQHRPDLGARQSEPEDALLTVSVSGNRHSNFDNAPVNSGLSAMMYAAITATPPSSRKLQDHTAPLSNRASSSAALKSTNQSAGSWSTQHRPDRGARQSEPEDAVLTMPVSVKRHSNFDHAPLNSSHSATTHAPITAIPPSSRKLQDHVAHYSNKTSSSAALKSTIHSAGSMSTNRSVSSNTTTKSMGSSTTSSDANVFNSHIESAGFTFDAFGLDASTLNQEVSQAMSEIDTNNVIGFADEFSSSLWMGDSPSSSRSSTPNVSLEEADGFVDGFRVTQPKQNIPIDVKDFPSTTAQSPMNFDTSSSRPFDGHSGHVNRFKGHGEFAVTKRPPLMDEETPLSMKGHSESNATPQPLGNITSATPFRSFGAFTVAASNSKARVKKVTSTSKSGYIQRHPHAHKTVHASPTRMLPATPSQSKPVPTSPRHMQPQNEVEFVDDLESEESTPKASLVEASEIGARLDIGSESDNGVNSDYIGRPSNLSLLKIPAATASNKDKKKLNPDTLMPEPNETVANEEKKDEDTGASLEKTVGSLKSHWENRVSSAQFTPPACVEGSRRPVLIPREEISGLQSKLGDSILSPERLEQHQSVMSEEAQLPMERITTKAAFSSIQQGLRSSPVLDAHETKMTKSEGGAAVRHSHLSQVLNSLQKSEKEDSLRDTQSDTGAPVTFAVRLRKTVFDDRTCSSDDSESRQSGQKKEENETETSPSASDKSTEEIVKHTYGERCELDLQKQREEEDNLQGSKNGEEFSDPYARPQIINRVACNKQKRVDESEEQQSGHQLHSHQLSTTSDECKIEHYTIGVDSSEQSEGSRQDEVPELKSASTTGMLQEKLSPSRRRNSDLIIEPEHDDKSHTSEPKPLVPPSAAVSHLLMLQQLQQRQEPSDHNSVASGRGSLSVMTTDTVVSEESQPRSTKAHTPKATMMMLNAFLAGRESITSCSEDKQAKPDLIDFEGEGSDFKSPPKGAQPAPNSNLPALKDDPTYERYFKMLKVSMPLEVVKHAMIRDGLDPTVLDGDHNKPAGILLKDDPAYQKYFKMLNIGLPMEAVKHAMERDGLDSHVMDLDHNLPVANGKAIVEQEPQEKDSHRRARLHWKTLRKVTSNSLWAQIDQDDELENIDIDEEEFQELFQVEKSETVTPVKAAVVTEKSSASVRVIDAKRANNGGIILARLKMSHDDMADAVDRINEHALSAEQIEKMIEFLPTKDERKALEAYMLGGGQDAAEKFEGLCECEKFMVSMMTVKHAKQKVRALLFRLQFETCIQDIQKDTVVVEAACDELSNSIRLRQLLGIVLTFGNRLNTAGNRKRKAGAFTLDSLLKLNQAKAFDKKTTFLQYIVLIVRRNNELLLRFKDDLPSVLQADKVFWDQCVSDLEEVENQLENVRRIALHQARQAKIYRLPRKKSRGEENEEDLSDADISLSLEEEVEALRATPIGLFTLSAIKYVSSLRDKVEETKSKFASLLEYFGEDDKEMQPHQLFSIIVSFSRDFEKAKNQVFTEEKRKQREERKRQAKSNGLANDGKPLKPSPTPLSEPKAYNGSSASPSLRKALDSEYESSTPSERVLVETPLARRNDHLHSEKESASEFDVSIDNRGDCTDAATSNLSIQSPFKSRKYAKFFGGRDETSTCMSFDTNPHAKANEDDNDKHNGLVSTAAKSHDSSEQNQPIAATPSMRAALRTKARLRRQRFTTASVQSSTISIDSGAEDDSQMTPNSGEPTTADMVCVQAPTSNQSDIRNRSSLEQHISQQAETHEIFSMDEALELD